MPVSLDEFQVAPFTAAGFTHDVYRSGDGPAVVVIAEIPGITPKVLDFAGRVRALGASIVMPHLFGEPGKPPSAGYALKSLAQVCVSREFSCLATGSVGPVTGWLRALGAAEHRRCGGPGIGVVGMCFTGNYALAMAVDDIVVAPVLSQPSLPFPLGKARQGAVAVSEGDVATLKARAERDGTTVLGLRFTGDMACREPRFDTLRRTLGDRFVAVEIDSSPGNRYGHPRNAHSVLTEHLVDEDGSPTKAALHQVLALLEERLGLNASKQP
ncbi:dienelactone hydrolase family protein [Acidiferrimicrobium sp. IK]|uniref:dienelactone hydrolase family protein n=1 Tax=Acidiferrimicrobium sp. IK TaxID=2871700 RepID=UPI0021CB2B0F|nr:dienelactone hydrolase family protein [Acidiferrimicrobium sp. IK]MCU4186808.1 dienelactone hydrolase family protein [Acidiferrimicrobium sp. IK]